MCHAPVYLPLFLLSSQNNSMYLQLLRTCILILSYVKNLCCFRYFYIFR